MSGEGTSRLTALSGHVTRSSRRAACHVTCGGSGPGGMAAPRVVPGEASESDSEPEPPGASGWGGPGAGLKVPGEASETEEEEEEEEEEAAGRRRQRPDPPPVSVEDPAPVWGGPGVPSLLQQRLGEGWWRLRGAVGGAVRQSYGQAARRLGGLGGALGRAQAAAATAAHSLRLARRDLGAVAATVDIVTACRLLPDIRGPLP